MKLSSIKTIREPIAAELKEFEIRFKEAMKSQVPLLDKITYYIVQRKGKQLRPMFVLLSAKIFGEINDSSYHAAAMIEILHTATLVHDDVVDDSFKRRSFFSINALWKNKIAVLVGDYLFSQGMLLAVDNDEFGLLKIMSRTIKDMSEGELLQMEKARRLDIKEDIYYEIIRQKTAVLIAASCSAGVNSVSKDSTIIEKMRLFGEKIGIAFQIRDDLFDFGTDDVGKPLGIDIKEKKMTLPLIYALEKSSSSKKRHIINLIKNHNTKSDKVAEVIDFVRKSGGLAYAEEAMYRYREEAFKLLETFPDVPARTSMRDLVNYAVDRKK